MTGSIGSFEEINLASQEYVSNLKYFANELGTEDLRNILIKTRSNIDTLALGRPDLEARYLIALGLQFHPELRSKSKLKSSSSRMKHITLGPSYVFIDDFRQIWPLLSSAGQKETKARILAGLKYSEDINRDIRNIAHEFRCGAELLRLGWTLSFPEHDNASSENYDFLAKRGDEFLEVECKTIHRDTGQSVGREHLEKVMNYTVNSKIMESLQHSWDCSMFLQGRLSSQDPKKISEDILNSLSSEENSYQYSWGAVSKIQTDTRIEKVSEAKVKALSCKEFKFLPLPDAKVISETVVYVTNKGLVIRFLIFSKSRDKVYKSYRETIKKLALNFQGAVQE